MQNKIDSREFMVAKEKTYLTQFLAYLLHVKVLTRCMGRLPQSEGINKASNKCTTGSWSDDIVQLLKNFLASEVESIKNDRDGTHPVPSFLLYRVT